MERRSVGKNAVISFGGQIIIIALGFVVPRIFISNYGSDINGLLSTLGQVFTYLALLEAGISQAAKMALYKPLHDKSLEDISKVSSVARGYYRRISIFYIAAVIVVSIIAPLVLKTNVDKKTVFFVVLLEGLSGACAFYYIQTYYVILQADGHGFVNDSINLLYRVLSYIARIVLAINGVSIILLQACYLVLTIVKIFIYKRYFRNHYSWLSFSRPDKGEKLPDRNSYIIIEIAWTIFSSTDLIILSTFLSTSASSIYSVYNMVFVGLHSVLNAVYVSTNYVLGMKYHEGIKEYENTHDLYMSIFLGAMTLLMSVTIFLMIPFISIYTKNISDVNYIYPGLPIMFCLVQLLSWSRYIQGNLMGLAGRAKQTGIVSIIEAIGNVSLSMLLVGKYGIYGVLFATVITLPLKVIYTTIVSDRMIIHRSCWKSVKIIISNLLVFSVNVVFSRYVPLQIDSVVKLIIAGSIIFIVNVFFVGIVNCLVNPNLFASIRRLKGYVR